MNKLAIGSVLTLISTLAIAWDFVDTRFVKKNYFDQQLETVNSQITNNRKDYLEDKIFIIEMIPVLKRTDYQRAQLNRYKARLGALK